ncbi:MAG: NUDIX domain-containing protein [Chloroflexi bacterium]|nr:NUDIX domain-containing protein [Chloroflexota bacterium]MCI0576234.1 NUDIX domain-containing protein [Chloroflexota bacterium]MCI0645472.1 NUDIX domain-containing protein [Chloroflexota bacterium]MCI0730611.1 NUDIX domain-containing protein [Chloroflexota bacterium]
MANLSRPWKETTARLVQVPLVRRLMGLAIRLVVARHPMGVAVIGFNEGGQILMLRHVFHPLAPWGVPGGWLDRQEDPADCALRELKEETGLTARLGPVVHLARERHPSHVGIAYIAQIRPGPLSLSGEIIEAGWFQPDALPGPLLPFVSEAIQRATRCHRLWLASLVAAAPGEMVYE